MRRGRDATDPVGIRMSEPLVGLGMPVYNGARYVAAAIHSILGQSLGDLELVICDNASTDGTEEICRGLAAQDPRVRYLRNPVNLGAHPNFNLAFRNARGRYFKWAPHDDELRPDYLRECVAALEGNPDAALCQTDIEYIGEAGETIGTFDGQIPGSDSQDAAIRFAALTLRPHDCYDVMGVFRRKALEESRLLESFHGADRALLAQIATYGRTLHVHRPLLRVRDHAGRYTRAMTRPGDRARWHDSRLAGKRSFPTWRLYGRLWQSALHMRGARSQRTLASVGLLRWWFVNWNAIRMGLDVVANVAPGSIAAAERIKQRYVAPQPGVGEVRRSGEQ